MQEHEPTYISHLFQRADGSWAIQSNEEHARDVARRAEEFAAGFGMPSWGRALGLLHDKGKESDAFQAYIRKTSGYDPKARWTGETWHAFVGGVLVHHIFNGAGDCLLANPVIAHHTGLYDQSEVQSRVVEPLPEGVRPGTDNVKLERPPFGRLPGQDLHHLTRMLFSCLVDADRLDAEAFMDPQTASHRGAGATMRGLLGTLRAHLERLSGTAEDTPVNRIRRRVQERCAETGRAEPGFYSLTVPTGGGKTLSSLLWALEHAVAHDLRRIIIAIPYTSIIVQTAATLKAIFGEENVLEHHSDMAATERDETYDTDLVRTRLATENWDAPIVVTTNVQLFESMFAAAPSACRKLHNIVRSVLILDEAQMLPMQYLRPIVGALDTYHRLFRVSVLLTTASQPQLQGHIEGTNQQKFDAIQEITELIPADWALHEQLRRTSIEVLPEALTYDTLARQLVRHKRVLCIVTRRKDAREVFRRLPCEGITVHLSRSMCPVHVRERLEDVKQALRDDTAEVIRVVSTSLIEAGVDIDFPAVYRQEAGLDSILQAAGRCNREGRQREPGVTRVFSLGSESPLPSGTLTFANEARKDIEAPKKGIEARNKGIQDAPDWFAPDTMAEYFRCLYRKYDNFDKAQICASLDQPEPEFRTAGTPIFVEASRQQRNTLMLRDVRYRLYARLVYIPVSQRPKGHAFDKHRPGDDESPKKYNEMFLRRASQGQCFTQPYFGTRECAAYYRLVTDVEKE